MSFYFFRDYFTQSAAKAVKGGIKAQSKRGHFGRTWWAKRWIAILESFDIGERLARGRSYARKGQVVSIHIAKGSVTAKVQGSRARPYDVSIKVKPLWGPEWRRILNALSEQAIFAAKLLAGEMPENIEEVFTAQKLSLFPERLRELETDCSCPDWSNPCKHIAAVYYLIGEEFDRDPFLIFKLRGLDREELVKGLGYSDIAPSKGHSKPEGRMQETEATPPAAPEPLPADPELFWRSSAPLGVNDEQVVIPRLSAALVKRLGSFPLWRGSEQFLDVMERVYSSASHSGLEVYLSKVLRSTDMTR